MPGIRKNTKHYLKRIKAPRHPHKNPANKYQNHSEARIQRISEGTVKQSVRNGNVYAFLLLLLFCCCFYFILFYFIIIIDRFYIAPSSRHTVVVFDNFSSFLCFFLQTASQIQDQTLQIKKQTTPLV